MKTHYDKEKALILSRKKHSCLSCGNEDITGRKRYCSIECRQTLRFKLNLRTGLLSALHIRFATFHFSDSMIIMDMLPYGSKETISFVYPRTKGKKPAEDFSRMANAIGDMWWSVKRRTNKHYIASRHVIEKAAKNRTPVRSVKPPELRRPTIKDRTLLNLRLGRADLYSAELHSVIRNAYRRQAKINHPDIGGSPEAFRQVHQAYEELSRWARNPTFITTRGFVDKWFYDGDKNRWVQPAPLPRSSVAKQAFVMQKKESACQS
jgi:hypothetical protein